MYWNTEVIALFSDFLLKDSLFSYVFFCTTATPVEVGCTQNGECPPNLACTNKGCVDPCASEPCSPRAICTVEDQDRAHVCTCPPGFTGDAYYGVCLPIKKGECDHDDECADDKACYDHQCRSPCSPPGHRGRVCGTNAECHATLHRAVCQCPYGWAGNPKETCYKRETQVENCLEALCSATYEDFTFTYTHMFCYVYR
jgi:hypothetical protein